MYPSARLAHISWISLPTFTVLPWSYPILILCDVFNCITYVHVSTKSNHNGWFLFCNRTVLHRRSLQNLNSLCTSSSLPRGTFYYTEHARASELPQRRQQQQCSTLYKMICNFSLSPSIQTRPRCRSVLLCSLSSGEWRTTGFFDCESNALPGSVNAD